MKMINRRNFIKTTAIGGAALSIGMHGRLFANADQTNSTAKIALQRTTNRKFGVKKVIKMFDPSPMTKKHVIVKPNFNTSDPAPASTHNDTLEQLIKEIKLREADHITLTERSYQNFDEVIDEKGIKALADELGFDIKNLDLEEYTVFNRGDLHWNSGFRVPNIINDAEYIVTTCCLKTHFIGVITMSLKLGVGILPKIHMRELHRSKDINSMIAEINLAYEPDLIVMDGVKTFISGGPSKGEIADGNVMLAATDRVALDAVGTAILIDLGTSKVMRGKIFEVEQIKRAAELGIGISSPDDIDFICDDDESSEYANRIKQILLDG